MTVEKPHTPQEVAELIAAGLAADEPLEIIGTGSRRALGRPVAAERVLDVSGLSGISLHEPEELVLTAAAGTPLAEIEAALAEKGQMLAFEPPDFSHLLGNTEHGGGTLGGMAAAGLSGPRRIRAGAVRDHVLGFAGVTGRAEIFKSGGRVMKNVTGFDLSKLMCGSWGTLAVLTELTFKVLPAPETVATLIFRGLDARSAVRLMTAAMRAPAEVSGAAHLPDGAEEEGRTCIRVEGFAPSVAARVEMLKGLLAEFGTPEVAQDAEARAIWEEVRDVLPLASDRQAFVWRICCPPAQGGEVAEALLDMIPEGRLFLDWAGGLIWLAVPPSDHASAELVRGAISGCGGHAMLFRAPEEVRRRLPVFHPQPEPLAEVTARVRAAFDPREILNPGRMHPSEKREG